MIVYGRNNFRRDPDTGNRISRPADAGKIIDVAAPPLQKLTMICGTRCRNA
ncbi:hypothetical protein RB2083_1567 [Rhodobacteraceae bacterium HTCC2083]|nr:hypothetical protein RB2083_1567 [Rhodobacteraceae bacterium HTCC2083]